MAWGKGYDAKGWGGKGKGKSWSWAPAWQPQWGKGKGKGKSMTRSTPAERKVWIGGLPEADRDRDANKELKALLETSPSGGCKFVEFSKGQGAAIFGTAEQATAAIAALNGSVFRGSVIQLDVWTKKDAA
eukprot:TRINITY_DN1886_c4_g1_i1.p2 TRINITY_DN1886_c4_g1~~TRINITY_DN1886_c4_g1_i1.p2  ORF type:complete len:130 (-),score=35.87 TRINITY_DN1886_c4_g1_i1:65-454(-)